MSCPRCRDTGQVVDFDGNVSECPEDECVPKQTLRVSPAMMQSFIGSVVGAFVGQKVADILAGLPTVANAVAGLPKDFNPNPEPSDPLREVAEEKLREKEEED